MGSCVTAVSVARYRLFMRDISQKTPVGEEELRVTQFNVVGIKTKTRSWEVVKRCIEIRRAALYGDDSMWVCRIRGRDSWAIGHHCDSCGRSFVHTLDNWHNMLVFGIGSSVQKSFKENYGLLEFLDIGYFQTWADTLCSCLHTTEQTPQSDVAPGRYIRVFFWCGLSHWWPDLETTGCKAHRVECFLFCSIIRV